MQPARPRQRLWLHAVLFGLTSLSAVAAYALPRIPASTPWGLWTAVRAEPGLLWRGVPFALTLMAILLAHEMGHYITARRYGVDQSLPFFIPAPTLFGTLGAVILMRSQPANRRVLLNVAVMGPYAGLALAVPAVAWGLAHSTVVAQDAVRGPYAWFGSSLLFSLLEWCFSPDSRAGLQHISLHPVGLAGWVGLFITSLNLIPASQLDGGHVAYALFGPHFEKISLLVAGGLLAMGTFLSLGAATAGGDSGGALVWIFWALLLFVFGPSHPPVRDEAVQLTRAGRINAWAALALFAVTFIPVPYRLVEGDAVLHLEQVSPVGRSVPADRRDLR